MRKGTLPEEFAEISHCGGKITFRLATQPDGRRTYQIQYTGTGFMVMVAVYALPQGIPVGDIKLGGIGTPWNPPPVPGCFPVFLASDSEGDFGHDCPACGGYWRSGPWPNVCPYCGAAAEKHEFLSNAQRKFVREYCGRLMAALDSAPDGDVVIDMDAVADAVGKDGEKPPFYVSEKSQQHKFTCAACGHFNDILGRFGYCSSCGTRNDLAIFREVTIPALRDRLNGGAVPEDSVRDAVGDFDTILSKYGRELGRRVPLIAARRTRLETQRYHNLGEVAEMLAQWFGIDLRAGLSDVDWQFARRMFFRRHVYEHLGGEVDQKYLDDSGDTTVVLRQHIHEDRADVHTLLGLLLRMATNLHRGFHDVLPAIEEPIRRFVQEEERLSTLRKPSKR